MKEPGFCDHWMKIAIKEARRGGESGEVPVGALIVHRPSNKLVAGAHNLVEKENNPLMHAEILAINNACIIMHNKFLLDCDIYVSLEPCAMCAAAISFARLGRLFYAASDPKQGGVENGQRFYTSSSCFHRPEVYPGIAAEISTDLMKGFFSQIRKNNL